MDIFSSQPGAVVALASPGVPMTFTMENWHLPLNNVIAYPVGKSILTNIDFRAGGDVGFYHALRDFISVYSFGEHIGQLRLSGLSFASSCNLGGSFGQPGIDVAYTRQPDGTVASQFIPNYHGIEWAFSYYNAWRTSTYGAPIRLQVGHGTLLYGFLHDFEFSGSGDGGAAKSQIFEFTMTFSVLPKPSPLDLLAAQTSSMTGVATSN